MHVPIIVRVLVLNFSTTLLKGAIMTAQHVLVYTRDIDFASQVPDHEVGPDEQRLPRHTIPHQTLVSWFNGILRRGEQYVSDMNMARHVIHYSIRPSLLESNGIL